MKPALTSVCLKAKTCFGLNLYVGFYDVLWALKNITKTQAIMCFVAFYSLIRLLLFELCCAAMRLQTGQGECRTDSKAQVHWRHPEVKRITCWALVSSCPLGTMIHDRLCEVVEEVYNALRTRGRENWVVCQQEDY